MKRKQIYPASAKEHMGNGFEKSASPPKKLKPQQSLFGDDDVESLSSIDRQSSAKTSENELNINEAFAKRFEHNKKREERQRCM